MMHFAALSSSKNFYSRLLNIPGPVAALLYALLIAFLILRQLTRPDGYLGSSNAIPSIPFLKSAFASATPDRPIQIVFTENQAAHDEVVAPMLEAFAAIPNVNISGIFLSTPDRFGSFDMYSNLKVPITLPAPRPAKELFPWVFDNPPDFIVGVSCGYDDFDKYKTLLENGTTHMFCTVHHSDHWNDWFFGIFQKKLGPWVRAKRVDFLTLSEHVANDLPERLLAWKEVKWEANFPPIRIFPPVFTLDHPPISTEDGGDDEIDFALQGNYDAYRRNYTHVFQEMKGMKELAAASNTPEAEHNSSVRLHLVGSGSGKPKVPSNVKDVVVFDENLNYIKFYDLLGSMTAILPAFADANYYHTKASSSVPASLVAGSPLVATRKLLNAYTYVDEDAVWLQKDDQEDFDMLVQIMKKPREERLAKVEKARQAATFIVENNKQLVAEWVEIAMNKRAQRLADARKSKGAK